MLKRFGGAVLLTGVVLSLLLSGCGGQEKQGYTTVHPERDVVENIVEDTGLAAYRDPYSVIPLVNGTILSCGFEEGDTVTRGQELYVIDSSDLEDQITQAQLSLNSAAESYRQAAAACEDLTVISYASGSVTAVYVHVGDFVSTGTPVAQVVDNVNLKLTVPFAREDALMLTPGSTASITFSAYGDALDGVVERIYSASTALPGGREGVNVELSFVNPGVIDAGTVAMATVDGVSAIDSGTVEYATAQTVYSTQSGQVMDLPIQVGDLVSIGQSVMTIDNASLTNAVSSAALARESAAVSLAQLEAKREDYVILAPVDGVVVTRNFKTGDFAAAATPMATIVQAQSMCVNVAIDEIYIEHIWPGQTAEVTFTADTGEKKTYGATVRRVDDTGTTVGGVTDYTVELELETTEGLKSGMNVDVSILAERVEDCLRLPEQAVSGGKVQVLTDGAPEERTVETGLYGGGYVEIVSGLSETDEVVLPQ